MDKNKRTTDAVEILHRRYIKGSAEREASLSAERVNAEVAAMVCDVRADAGLTQKELADLIGTTQSVISRLEDADYDGHSLSMLKRIADGLKVRLTVSMTAPDRGPEPLRYAFQDLVRNLRRRQGLSVDDLAAKMDIDRSEVVAMERIPGYHPQPRTLRKLADFSGIPSERLLALVGAVRPSPEVAEKACRYAAQSESSAKLTPEERRILDEFVTALKTSKEVPS